MPSGPPQRKVTHLRKHAGQHSEQLYAELPQIVEDLIRVIGTVRLAEQPLQNQDDHFRLLVESVTRITPSSCSIPSGIGCTKLAAEIM